jgi:signal peptidase I
MIRHCQGFCISSLRRGSRKCRSMHIFSTERSISSKPKGEKSEAIITHGSSPQADKIAVELSILVSRVLAAFGILHVVTEYGVDLTRCEGPSMMPTIKALGEIIVIEKTTHRIWGLEGGNNGEVRAEKARDLQKKWEAREYKKFLLKSKRNDVYVPTWYEPKLPQTTKKNYAQLSSFSQIVSKFSSGINIGDVVVLEHSDREGTVCKRVLGLPGDIVLRPKQSSLFSSEHRDVVELFEDDEKVDGRSQVKSLSDSSLLIVPDGHIWVEGDNSTNSADSRNYGPVPSALVVGKVWFRLWPIRGFAQMVRGGRPMPPKHAPFTGSAIIPAGNEGEERRVTHP